MGKIKVDNFEELIVVLLINGQVRVPHGSINASQPGVWQSRETTNIIVVDMSTPARADFNWQEDVFDGSGRTLKEYRRDRIVWEAQQVEEPESRAVPESPELVPQRILNLLPFHQVQPGTAPL